METYSLIILWLYFFIPCSYLRQIEIFSIPLTLVCSFCWCFYWNQIFSRFSQVPLNLEKVTFCKKSKVKVIFLDFMMDLSIHIAVLKIVAKINKVLKSATPKIGSKGGVIWGWHSYFWGEQKYERPSSFTLFFLRRIYQYIDTIKITTPNWFYIRFI